MYEGKNIHYSPLDNKPLCSFSQKQCNQRRLNGYGFCVRHILEDPTAPFRRCAYVAKSSQHLCTQAIPLGEARQYCNNHMQVLGMLPRRERKPKKEKDKDKDKDKDNKDKDNLTTTPESNKMTFGDRLKSKKLSMPKASNSPLLGKVLNPVDDPDDPYAFHDAIPEGSPVSSAQTGMSGMGGGGLADMASRSPYPQSLPSPSQSRTAGDIMGVAGLSKAKLYPELAEKLEKVRATPETKPTKSRARISRTMNKLQTKIAQNKIKDKLRKSQESSQAESPSQVASPERLALNAAALLNSGIVGSDFGAVTGSDANAIGMSAGHLHPLTLPGFGLPGIDSSSGRGLGVAGLSGAGSHMLGIERLNQEGLPSQLPSPLHPLPPPYPGLPLQREHPFSPTHSQVLEAGRSPVDKPPVTTSLPSHTPVSPLLSFSQASSLSSPVVSPAQSQPQHVRQQRQPPHPRQQPSQQLPSHPPQASQSSSFAGLPKDFWSPTHHSSVLNQSLPGRPSFSDSAVSSFPQTSAILTSKNLKTNPILSPSKVDFGSSLDLRPPPPYVPRSLVSSVPTSVTNHSSVSRARVHRPKGVLTEKEARIRLRNDDAVKVYGIYAHQRVKNHVFVEPCMSLCASDEEETSEEEMDNDLLPYQRDWKVISDDEEDNEFEEDGELPSDLRMVKLGVMRARYRRHCTQTKHATRINTKSMMSHKKFTLALLRLARERPSSAAHTLAAICSKPLQWPQERRQRRKMVWRKVCQYKDGADKQCTVMCLPYTNHCRKHVMYNVDQQLFQFCTAKNSDNTQCCMPVIDIRHDFPLCFPHALQAEHQQKEEMAEVKKRPRKKTKPPALTRPPRKGKKKKGKNARPQKPMPPDKPTGDISMPETEPMEITPTVPESQPDSSNPSAPPATQPNAPAPPVAPVAASTLVGVAKEKATQPSTSGGVRVPKDNKQLEQALGAFDLDETLSPDFDKPFELPLEQASRLLEDQDFENFPDDAFNDIFSMAEKNGEPDALAKENEKLERQLAFVTDNVLKTKDTLEKLLAGEISMEDLPEHETKQLAEAISLLPSISGEGVQPTDMAPTSAAPVLDPYSAVPRDQPLPTMTLQQTPLPPQAPLPDFVPLVTVAGGSRELVGQPSAAFLPASVSASVNGITVPGVGQQNSVVYNPGSLPVGFAPTSSALHQQAGAVAGGGQVYAESCLPQGYHMVQTAAQGQGQLAGFQGLQGLPSAVLLSGAGTELTLTQQQALLASRLASQQARASVTASPSPQVVNRQIEVVGGGVLQAPSPVTSRPNSTVSTLHPQPVPTPTASRPQAGPSVVTVQPHQGPSTSVLATQLQGQPVLAAQLASGVHPTWAALQQPGNAGYHINGFPATQLAFSNAAVSVAHTTSAKSSTQQAKFNANALHVNNVTLPGSVNATASLSSVVKHELHVGATTHLGSPSPSSPATGLKQDPRIAVLTQQHSRTGGSVGSPSRVPHSPSPPTHSPQGLNQTLPPFSAALPAYQSTGTGS